MKRLLNRLWPDSMLHQILVLLAISGLFMIMVGAAVIFVLKQHLDQNLSIMNSHFVSVAIGKLNETEAQDRPAVLEGLRRDLPDLTIELVGEEVLAGPGIGGDGIRFGPFRTGETLLGMRIEHVVVPGLRGNNSGPLIYVRLRDGALVAADWGLRAPPPSVLGMPFFLFFGFLALTFCGLMIWAARGLVGPLSDLASAARNFGESSTAPVPIRESGPREVRAAAHAFNRMQLRIDEFLNKRTRMLAAVSHDLRTPLTRLGLRLDLLEEGEIRDRSLRDLQQMEQQLDSALTFLRDGATSEPVQRIDLPSFLQSLADQYADIGHVVTLGFEAGLAVEARTTELTRALCNLIDNATHHASDVEIRASRKDDTVRIDVIDHGPGIAEADRVRLLEPFERGDAARQLREGTGFGLGLPTARAVAEAASGRLDLLDTAGGGLTVRLTLPVAQGPRPDKAGPKPVPEDG